MNYAAFYHGKSGVGLRVHGFEDGTGNDDFLLFPFLLSGADLGLLRKVCNERLDTKRQRIRRINRHARIGIHPRTPPAIDRAGRARLSRRNSSTTARL